MVKIPDYNPPPAGPSGAQGGVLATPTGLAFSDITDTTATFTFNAVPNATAYEINFRIPPATAWTNVGSVPGNTVPLSLLAANTTYDLRVRATANGFTSSGWSTVAQLTTAGTATTTQLATPTGLSSTSITATGATVNWSAVANASGYTIGYRTTAGGGAYTDITIGSGTTTSRAITGLTASTGYDWRIRATGTGNFTDSGYSAVQTFTTSAPATTQLTTPGSLSQSVTGTTAATLEWGAVANASGYTIGYRIGTGARTDITVANGTTTSQNLTGLTGNSSYNWRIRATGTGNFTDSGYSADQSFSTSRLATPTAGLDTTAISETGATANWTAIANATRYVVQFSSDGGTTWTTRAAVTGTSDAFTGLAPSTAYRWRVRQERPTHNAPSFFSTAQTFTTSAATADGSENNPYIITDFNTDLDVLNRMRLHPNNPQGTATYFRINDPAAGDWEMVFTTTPAGQDFDTHFRAKNAAGGNVDTASETGDGTPHTLEVTANAATTWLQIEIQDWHSGGNPTAATLRINSPAPAVTYEFAGYTDDEPNPGETITANFTGSEPSGTTYQWQFRNTSGDSWGNLSGQTSRTITIHERAVIGREYRIRWTYGGTTYDTTTYATVVAVPVTALPAPTGLTSSSVTNTTASLSWTAVPNANNYTVRYRITGSYATVDTATTSQDLTGLTANQTYEWSVRANASGNFANSVFADNAQFTTRTTQSDWQLFAARGETGTAGSGFNWRGEWSNTTAYSTNDIVHHNGSAWRASQNGTGNEPSSTSRAWNLFADRGTAGVDGTGFNWRGAWSSTAQYAINDVVSHSGSSWVAERANRNATPSGSSNDWDLFSQKGDKGDKGDRGDDGRDGGAADRAPGLFHVQITEAQETSLRAAGNTALPTALRNAANNATPGGNRIGDFVRFFRNTANSSYSDYWLWTDRTTDRWERVNNFIGAAQISAVNVSAITGTVPKRANS